MKLDKTQAKRFFREDDPDFETVEQSEFEGDKYQYATMIAKHIPTGKHYSAEICRSGSYFTDWWYDHEDRGLDLQEVEQVTKTITVTTWEPVAEESKGGGL